MHVKVSTNDPGCRVLGGLRENFVQLLKKQRSLKGMDVWLAKIVEDEMDVHCKIKDNPDETEN